MMPARGLLPGRKSPSSSAFHAVGGWRRIHGPRGSARGRKQFVLAVETAHGTLRVYAGFPFPAFHHLDRDFALVRKSSAFFEMKSAPGWGNRHSCEHWPPRTDALSRHEKRVHATE